MIPTTTARSMHSPARAQCRATRSRGRQGIGERNAHSDAWTSSPEGGEIGRKQRECRSRRVADGHLNETNSSRCTDPGEKFRLLDALGSIAVSGCDDPDINAHRERATYAISHSRSCKNAQ